MPTARCAGNRIEQGLGYLIPALADSPGISRALGVYDVDARIVPSPVARMPTEHSCSIISLGSPAYSLVSGIIERQHRSKLSFDSYGNHFSVPDNPRITDPFAGEVERAVDRQERRSLFCGPGLSEPATARAGSFSVDEWKRLYGRFGSDSDFIVVTRFDLSSLSSWEIIH